MSGKDARHFHHMGSRSSDYDLICDLVVEILGKGVPGRLSPFGSRQAKLPQAPCWWKLSFDYARVSAWLNRRQAGVCRCVTTAISVVAAIAVPSAAGIYRSHGHAVLRFDLRCLESPPRISAAGFSAQFQHRPSSLHTVREGVATSALAKGRFIGIAKALDASAQPSAVVRIASLMFMENPFSND